MRTSIRLCAHHNDNADLFKKQELVQMKSKTTIQIKENHSMQSIRRIIQYNVYTIAAAILLFAFTNSLQAQNIGWEGETGVFVTPLAYTAASPVKGLGHPLVAYHFLNGGEVLGDFYNVSATIGAFSRAEFGYTRSLHSLGGDPNFSPLWNNGFNIVHGKVNVVPENAGNAPWVPAISVGFIARSQVRNVGGVFQNKDTTNTDFYLVASKTITQTGVPIILSAGVRGTNAQLWGLGGNAVEWEARAFGAAGFVVKLPKKATAIFAAEVAQQPSQTDQLPGAVIPTTITYAIRLSPAPGSKLNIDFGVAQVAGKIAPGVDLQARSRLGVQVSYGF
jgi:hypothetical protein